MRKFDTKVQHLKYKVLREVARAAWSDELAQKAIDIPKIIVPGKKPTMRCCVYKERAILGERVKLAMGGDKQNKNIIQVIDIACDECPVGGYEVTNACRGCLAHYCEESCKRGAITFDSNQNAIIDKTKCVECGACAKVCPYSAIKNQKRPCESSCKIKAITMDEDKAAKINNDKCIACGACVYQCPFGAISDTSFILEAIDLIKKSQAEKDFTLFAVVAPSVASQFNYAKLGQVITGIRTLGFDVVTEAALGADLVANDEAQELAEKKMLLSSCCSSFVSYIEKSYPALKKYVSHNLSPMATIAKYLKEKTPNSGIVFIGPCTSKKAECMRPEVHKYVDCAITFEELQALFDSRDIDITTLEESEMNNASYFGRIFARSGGVSAAVKEALIENNLDFDIKPLPCDGIEACKNALLRLSKNALNENFVEGMACVGGCIGGAGCLTHGQKDKNEIDKYSLEADEKKIHGAIAQIK